MHAPLFFACFWVLVHGANGNDILQVPPRRMSFILHVLPNHTNLSIGDSSALNDNAFILLHAGVSYSPVLLDVRPSSFGTPSKPSLRLVPATLTSSDAQAGSCENAALQANQVVNPWAQQPLPWKGVDLNLQSDGFQAQTSESLRFYMGGAFKLCYSNGANFSAGFADLLDITLATNGILDACAGTNCLANRAFNCFVLQQEANPVSSCVIGFTGIYGTAGKGSWTPAFSNITYNSTGALMNVSAKSCGTLGAMAESQYIGTDGVDRFIDIDNTTLVIPQTLSTLVDSTFKAFTVAACYCPDLNGCNDNSNFVQQIGTIYFFLSRVCATSNCSSDFLGVLPKFSFLVRVDCPPNGCSYENSSRVKLADSNVANNLPSWNAGHGCHSALHSPLIAPSGNCLSPSACQFSGGARQDYKLFQGPTVNDSFNILADGVGIFHAERYDLRTYQSPRSFDVCFCNSGCSAPGSWFKVGEFTLRPWRLLGLASDKGMVQLPTVSGSIGFARAVVDNRTLGLELGSIIKLINDENFTTNDATCGSAPYDASLVSGPSTLQAAMSYAGEVANSSTGEGILFNGGVSTRSITVNYAGVIAVCYCINTSFLPCTSSDSWKMSARFTVRGPQASQTWEFSVNVVARIEYHGFGLDSNNVLRIIDGRFSCTHNSGNPLVWDPAVHIGCPGGCQQVSNFPGQQTNLVTQVATQNATKCDGHFTKCNTAFLERIDTTSLADGSDMINSRTLLTFSADPHLNDGDILSLGSQINGGSDEQRATIRGIFPYADTGEYTVGVRVARHGTLDTTYVTPFGWLASSVPSFNVRDGMGDWTRHNRGATREELVAVVQRQSLKVCWAPQAGDAFLMEAGTISFTEPPAMTSASVSPASTVSGQSIPSVISFQTGWQSQYRSATHSTSLRLLITSRSFDINLMDSSTIPPSAEVNQLDATRQICALLFSELWSNDGRGFPYPQGCYYGTQQTQSIMGSREFFIVFDALNGLAPSTEYQLVVQTSVLHGLETGDEVLHIFTMADSVEQPYRAVELGRGILRQTPDSSTSTTSSQLSSLEVVSSSMLMTLGDSTAPFQVRLSGTSSRPVTAGSYLRLVFRPLTIWNLSRSCLATCTPSSSDEACGQVTHCRGEALTPGGSGVIAKVMLPQSLTPISGNVTPIIALWGIRLPEHGFFPTKMGVQVSDADDGNPQYLVSSGALLFKLASARAASIASVVTKDGNTRPFQGDLGNELYVRLAFSVTLRSKSRNEAFFVITLPPGYTCVSASKAEAALDIFRLQPLPARRGSLSTLPLSPATDGSWTFAANTCRYSIWENSAIYAGTIIYIKLAVNNPHSPLSLGDERNTWQLQLSSQGEMTSGLWSMSSVNFTTSLRSSSSAGLLARGVPVLGRITDVFIQPSDFTVGAQQQLQVYFRTGQGTAGRAMILLGAPPVYNFESSCTASDISDDATYSLVTLEPTRRLPGISRCSGRRFGGSVINFNRAVVLLSGRILGGARYAFQVAVRNPSINASTNFLSGWALAVHSIQGGAVDEASGLSLAPASQAVWGPYLERLQCSVILSSYKPFSLTQSYATITIFPIIISVNATAALRVIAPSGFLWIVNNVNFRYRSNSATSGGLPGVTADLPAGMPTTSGGGGALQWSLADYISLEVYGFACEIHVPDASPTTSSNVFFIELGNWSSTLVHERFAAAVISAQHVDALMSAMVIPSHTVQLLDVNFTFQVRTNTHIPHGGALLVVAPQDFSFSPPCFNDSVSRTMALPDGTLCSSQTVDGLPMLEVRPGSSGMVPGLYRFRVSGNNPGAVPLVAANTSNTLNFSTCGMSQCWLFFSVSHAADHTSILDYATSVSGFAVQLGMLQALLVSLNTTQRAAIVRDDRPGRRTRLIFAFRLNSTLDSSSVLRIRGPEGFIFNEDCLGDVEVQSARVFGKPSLWNSSAYTAWPLSANITQCDGTANTAQLTILPGLQQSYLYPWRIALRSTPLEAPHENSWTLEIGGESSLPIPSFKLRSFTNVGVEPVTMAQSTVGAVPVPVVAPVILTFQPSSQIYGGVLRIQAPTAFQFRFDRSRLCTAQLANYDLTRGWLPLNQVCRVDTTAASIALVELSSNVELEASKMHRIAIMVQNPGFEMAAEIWSLKSFSSASTTFANALDEVAIAGFPVVKAPTQWTIRTAAPHEWKTNGVATNTIFFEIITPIGLHRGDILEIASPPGFEFTNSSSARICNQFLWNTGTPAVFGPAISSLQNVVVSCARPSAVEISYNGSMAVGPDSLLAFSIRTRNPRITPSWIRNFWRFTHQRKSSVMSAGILAGFGIVAPLEDLHITMSGPLQTAATVTGLTVSFRTAGECDVISINARTPSGFDFAGAVLLGAFVQAATGSSITHIHNAAIVRDSTSTSLIRIAAAVAANHTMNLSVGNVSFASLGGLTEWTVTTFLSGNRVDMASSAGFYLPGLIQVSSQMLRGTFDQGNAPRFVRSALELAILGGWSPQRNSSAQAEFVLRFTNQVERFEELYVQAPAGYHLDTSRIQLFSINKTSHRVPVQIDTTMSTNETELNVGAVTILETIRARADHVLLLPLRTPRLGVTHGNWKFEVRNTTSFTVQSNDAQMPGFRLADVLEIDVSAAHAPPSASFPVNISLSLRNATPVALHVVAPYGFVFARNCTVSASIACVSTQFLGQSSAYVTPVGFAEFTASFFFQLLVMAPSTEPVSHTWLIQGLSAAVDPAALAFVDLSNQSQACWGEFRKGFVLTPLREIAVEYAAVPLLTTSLSLTINIQYRNRSQATELRMLPPTNYELTCAAQYLVLATLPGQSPVCGRNPMSLQFPDSIPEGEHLFIVGVTVPIEVPPSTSLSGLFFKVTLHDRAGSILDSNMQVPAKRITSPLLRVEGAALAWSSSTPSAETSITFSVTLKRSLPPTTPAATAAGARVAALLLRMPHGFEHQIIYPTDVTIGNPKFKERQCAPNDASCAWVQYDTQMNIGSYFNTHNRSDKVFNKVRISRDETQNMPAGTYHWTFPARLPSVLPRDNSWHLSLCSSRFCTSDKNTSAIITFVVPGFPFGATSPPLPGSNQTLPSSAHTVLIRTAYKLMQFLSFLLLLCWQ